MSLAESPYPTLRKLPGAYVDTYGNLKIKKAEKKDCGLRQYIDFVMKLNPRFLKDTKLSELLNWLRWGSTTTVMWECTLAELLKIVQKWQSVNAKNKEWYGIDEDEVSISWEKIWNSAKKFGVYEVKVYRRCRDNLDFKLYCWRCGESGLPYDRVIEGPRGTDTYNLVLKGYEGYGVANAVYFHEGPFVIPKHLQ